MYEDVSSEFDWCHSFSIAQCQHISGLEFFIGFPRGLIGMVPDTPSDINTILPDALSYHTPHERDVAVLTGARAVIAGNIACASTGRFPTWKRLRLVLHERKNGCDDWEVRRNCPST